MERSLEIAMATRMEQSGATDPQTLERRQDTPRRRVLKGAVLTFNSGFGAFECVMRNLSSNGALLRFGDAAAVPPVFDLHVAGEQSPRRTRLRWRGGTDVGVEFKE